MELVSLSPFPALLLPWEGDAGQASLTVVVKVTVQLVPDGDATVADTQLAITGDETWDDGPLATLHRPSDRAPLKPRTDIVLVGHAYAPGGVKVEQLVARVRVGDFEKAIAITATRPWTASAAGFVPGPPVPFDKMPLRYERAALSQDNPAGVDPAAPPAPGAPIAPNLEPVAPATFGCFGPIAGAWRPRRQLLGEEGRFWALAFETGAPSPEPAPRALDFRYFNAAPPDQQTSLLRQRAEIELVNLSPSHPTLRTRLPALRPQVFRLDPRARRPVEIALRCDTLWIDADQGVACLVWRGLTDVPSALPDAIGTVLVVADPQGRKVRWEQVERAWREGVPIEATEAAAADALAMRHDKVRAKEPGPEDGGERAKDETRAFDTGTSGSWRAALPFGDEASKVPFSERTLDPRDERLSRPATPFGGVESASMLGLSFGSALAKDPHDDASDLDFQETHTGSDDDTADREPDGAPDTALPFTASGSNPVAPALLFTTPGAAPVAPGPLPPAPGLPRPPAMLSIPLPPPPAPVPAPRAEPPPANTPRSDPPPAPATRAEPPRIEPAKGVRVAPAPEVAGPAFEPKDVPIALYGALSAELMIRRGERARVLEEHRLTEPSFARVHAHWTAEMGRETARGESKLLAQFDEAYVETMGRLRTPIGIPEYAAIQVAIERGAVDKQLSALSLSLSDLMRVQRVWTRRMADEPEIGKLLGKAIEEARAAVTKPPP